MIVLSTENYEVLCIYLCIFIFFILALVQILFKVTQSINQLIKFKIKPYQTLRDLDLETEFQQQITNELCKQMNSQLNSYLINKEKVREFCDKRQFKWKIKNNIYFVKVPDKQDFGMLYFLETKKCYLKLEDTDQQARLKCFLIDYPLQNALPIHYFCLDENLHSFVIIESYYPSLKDQIQNNISLFFQLDLDDAYIDKIMKIVLQHLYYLNRLNLWHNHICSENIFVNHDQIYIGRIYYMFLNYSIEQKYQNLKDMKSENFKRNELIDVLQFGHLLYELHFGFQSTKQKPPINSFQFLNKKSFHVLKLIFTGTEPSVNLKTLLLEYGMDFAQLDRQIPVELIKGLKE